MNDRTTKLSGCCNAAVDLLATLPICVRCNGVLLPETYAPFPERHLPNHNERCGMNEEAKI